jgi:hypothetical protein
MKKTLREKYIAGLLALGYARIDSLSSKFEVFTKAGSSATFFFVGKSGSLRFSTVRRVDSSVPASDRTKIAIISKGEAA